MLHYVIFFLYFLSITLYEFPRYNQAKCYETLYKAYYRNSKISICQTNFAICSAAFFSCRYANMISMFICDNGSAAIGVRCIFPYLQQRKLDSPI